MQIELFPIIQGIILLFGIGASWQNLKSEIKSLTKETKRINGSIDKLFGKTDVLEKDVATLEERTKKL